MKGIYPQKANPAILSTLLLQSQVENTLADISQGKMTSYSRALTGRGTAAAMRRIHYEWHDNRPETFIKMSQHSNADLGNLSGSLCLGLFLTLRVTFEVGHRGQQQQDDSACTSQ